MKKTIVFFTFFMVSLNTFAGNHYYLQKKGYSSFSELFYVLWTKGSDSINSFFFWCCDCISFLATICGMTYEEMNIVLFVVGQPLLIIIFLILWLRERSKRVQIQRP